MKKVLQFSAKHPWLSLISLLTISIIAASQAYKIKFDVSSSNFLLSDDPDLAFYQQTLDTFGSDKIMIAYFKDKQLFTQEKLASIQKTLQAIEKTKGVESVKSIFNIPHVRSFDGEITTTPYLKNIPSDKDAINTIIKQARKNPFIAQNLLSTSSQAFAAIIYLNSGIDKTTEQHVYKNVDLQLKQLTPSIDQAFQLSDAFIHSAIKERISHDLANTLPLALGVLLLALALALRRSSGLIIPTLSAGMSVLWTIGMMAVLDIPLNVMTSIIPALLIIIGSTEDIHLLTEYYAERKNSDNKLALKRMSSSMGGIISLTFFTTYLGFVSITLNSIELLQQFGLVASTGLLFNFLITLLLVPALIRISASNNKDQKSQTENTFFSSLAEKIYLYFRVRKTTVLIFIITITAASFFGISSLKVDNTTLSYFDKQSELNQRIHSIQSDLSGIESMSIILDSGIDGTFLQLKYLDEIKKLQAHLVDSGFADSTLSFVDYLSFLNAAMEEDESGDIYLPDDDSMVREYMSLINHAQVKSYISENHSQARIVIRHRVSSSHELNIWLKEIKSYIAKNMDAGLNIQITGESVLSAKAADYMVNAQTQSLILMISIIFIITSILFFSTKAGLVAIIPNLIPIFVLFGVMGFLGIPLNTGTAMTATIALGICVDDTMHFMMRYNRIAKSGANEKDVLLQTVRHEATPILTTSIALALGFAVMMGSSFPPIVHFGALSALVIFLAVIATFILTPVLLSYISLITIWDVISLRLKQDVLEKSPLFNNMTSLQVRKAVLLGHITQHSANETIVNQGKIGKEIYVLLDGTAQVIKQHPDGSINILDKLSAGDAFGEIALVSHQPRMANINTSSKVSLLSFNQEALKRITKYNPRIATKLYANISSILGNRFTRITRLDPMIIDDTTGALKKSVFQLILDKEINHSIRHKEELSLLVINLHKNINNISQDQQEKFAFTINTIIHSHLRLSDYLCRWEKSVFVLLMPKTSYRDASITAKRLMKTLNSLPYGLEKIDESMVTLLQRNNEKNAQEFAHHFDSPSHHIKSFTPS